VPYYFRVMASNGVHWGAYSATAVRLIQPTAPTARFWAIPSQVNGAVAAMPIKFSEPINGLKLSSFSLTRNGVSVPLNPMVGTATLSGSGSSYTVGNLASFTTENGAYVLSLSPLGVADSVGNPMVIGTTVSWTTYLNAESLAKPVVPTNAWLFNENSGTVAMNAVNDSATGTIVNCTWVNGVGGNAALHFNGTNSAVLFNTSASLSGTTDFTVSAWVRTTATSSGVIIQQRDAAGWVGEYQLSMRSDGSVNFSLFGSPLAGADWQFDFATSTKINDGLWHHVLAERNGTVGSIFIDGVQAGSSTGLKARSLDATISVAVGADVRDTSSYFNGDIDDVRIYNSALDAPSISALIVPAEPAVPKNAWLFDENSGTVAKNAVTDSAAGTIVNGTWVGGVGGTAALHFNGTNSAVLFDNTASLSGTTDFTVAAWVRTTAASSGIIIQQRDASGFNGQYQLLMNADGTVWFYVYGDSATQFDFVTTTKINDGRWHHVLAERNGTAGLIFIDGIQAGFATGSAIRPLNPTIAVAVGADVRDNRFYFNGDIDNVRIYDSALNASHISFVSSVVARPSEPQFVEAFQRDDDIILRWPKPVSLGDAAQVSYRVEVSNNGSPYTPVAYAMGLSAKVHIAFPFIMIWPSVCRFRVCAVDLSNPENSSSYAVSAALTPLGATPFDAFEYSASSTGFTITKYRGNPNVTEVNIPSRWRGLPVTAIASSAFAGATNIQRVVIPDTVATIGDLCFDHCISLRDVLLAPGLQTIGRFAFQFCSMDFLTIPRTVFSLGFAAFANSFRAGGGGTEIVVDPLSPFFDLRRGYVLSKDHATLIYVPNAIPGLFALTFGHITIEDGVTSIAPGAFAFCNSIQSITLPRGLTHIGDHAFVGCSSLHTIAIPAGVMDVGAAAFSGCSSLQQVTFPESLSVLDAVELFSGCSTLDTIAFAGPAPFVGTFAGTIASNTSLHILADSAWGRSKPGAQWSTLWFGIPVTYAASPTPPSRPLLTFADNIADVENGSPRPTAANFAQSDGVVSVTGDINSKIHVRFFNPANQRAIYRTLAGSGVTQPVSITFADLMQLNGSYIEISAYSDTSTGLYSDPALGVTYPTWHDALSGLSLDPLGGITKPYASAMDSEIEVDWDPPSINVDMARVVQYEVQCSPTQDFSAKVQSVSVAKTHASIAALSNGTSYFLRVRPKVFVFDGGGFRTVMHEWSPTTIATPLAGRVSLPLPAIHTISGSVTVSWLSDPTHFTQYRVLLSDDGIGFRLLGSTATGTFTTTLPTGKAFIVRVDGVDSMGRSVEGKPVLTETAFIESPFAPGRVAAYMNQLAASHLEAAVSDLDAMQAVDSNVAQAASTVRNNMAVTAQALRTLANQEEALAAGRVSSVALGNGLAMTAESAHEIDSLVLGRDLQLGGYASWRDVPGATDIEKLQILGTETVLSLSDALAKGDLTVWENLPPSGQMLLNAAFTLSPTLELLGAYQSLTAIGIAAGAQSAAAIARGGRVTPMVFKETAERITNPIVRTIVEKVGDKFLKDINVDSPQTANEPAAIAMSGLVQWVYDWTTTQATAFGGWLYEHWNSITRPSAPSPLPLPDPLPQPPVPTVPQEQYWLLTYSDSFGPQKEWYYTAADALRAQKQLEEINRVNVQAYGLPPEYKGIVLRIATEREYLQDHSPPWSF